MTTIIGGSSPSITFSDSTTQTTAFTSTPSVTSITTSGDASINGLTVGKGAGSDASSTVVGSGALAVNSSGARNTAMGNSALASNVSGVDNTAMGSVALYSNTGSTNTAVGRAALFTNNSGSSNTSIGYGSLQSNTTASNNTAVGYQAGYSATIDSNSTYIGYQAGYSANYGTASAQTNTYIGYRSGYSMTTGYYNTILGAYSGNQDGLDIRTASNYIVLSDGQGKPRLVGDNVGGVGINTTGGGGYWFKVYATNMTANYGMAIQNGTAANGGYFINFLNSSGNPAGYINQTGTTTVNYTASSDYRMKENITPLTGGLKKVLKLNPVTYTWKDDGGVGEGFIAHDLQKHIPLAVSGEKDEIDDKGNPKYQGIDYGKITTTLVLALQELKTIVDAQAAEIAELKAKVA